MIYSLSFLFLGLLIITPQFTQASALATSFDFRHRYEYTDDDSKSAKRRRHRIRTRLGAQYSPNERLKIKEEMIDKNNEKTELEQKWSNDRKSYEENIEDLQLTKKRNENDIKKLNKNYDDLENEKDIIQNELNTYHIPAYKIVWRRFKELVG